MKYDDYDVVEVSKKYRSLDSYEIKQLSNDSNDYLFYTSDYVVVRRVTVQKWDNGHVSYDYLTCFDLTGNPNSSRDLVRRFSSLDDLSDYLEYCYFEMMKGVE